MELLQEDDSSLALSEQGMESAPTPQETVGPYLPRFPFSICLSVCLSICNYTLYIYICMLYIYMYIFVTLSVSDTTLNRFIGLDKQVLRGL